MKQNKIRISVELWDKDNNVHSHFGGDKVTVVQEMELPVPLNDGDDVDDGTGQIAVVLHSFQRHLFKELKKLGVIDKVDVGQSLTLSLDSKLFNEAFEKVLDDIATEYGVPKYMLLGREKPGVQPIPFEPVAAIDPDPQSVETCDKCKGHGYLQSNVPTSTNQHGEVFYDRIPCPSCAGAGKVGV